MRSLLLHFFLAMPDPVCRDAFLPCILSRLRTPEYGIRTFPDYLKHMQPINNSIDAAIEARELVKVYDGGASGRILALDGLTFSVERGKIFGLLGPNGAGKTTLLKILTTLIPATAGSARVMGRDVAREPLAVRRSICVVLQQNAVEQYLSVEDNFFTYGRFHGLSRREIEVRSGRVIETFGLEGERRQKVIDLSGGMKRRVQVAKVFMIDAPVVFLDEATTGMDPINKRATIAAVASEAGKGRTIVLTTHLLEEAEELCDTILIVDKGRKVIEGGLYDIKQLSRGIVDVSITFDNRTAESDLALAAFPALRVESRADTVLLTIDTAAVSPYDLIDAARSASQVRAFEVRGATLEDIFIQLLGEKR